MRISKSARSQSGFTLVEIMIVVVIIGILATLGLPAFRQVRMQSQNSRFYQDVRVFASAAEMYMLESGASPFQNSDFGNPGAATLNTPMDEYIKQSSFFQSSPIGGQYAFAVPGNAFFGVGAVDYGVDEHQLNEMEKNWDDGNLTTGNLRRSGAGYYFVILD